MILSKPRKAGHWRSKVSLTAAGLWLLGLHQTALPSQWVQAGQVAVERPPVLEVAKPPQRRRARNIHAKEAKWAPLPAPDQVEPPESEAIFPLAFRWQVWAHSCVSKKKLEAALQDSEVTAIEVDVAMGYLSGPGSFSDEMVPVMAHPPILTSDLTFQDFLEELIRDGRRHDLEAVRRCLPLLAERSGELAANGQAVWLNADVLPGPGLRSWSCSVPAEEFLRAAEEHCPGAHLSLGWKANPVGSETYNEASIVETPSGCVKRHVTRLIAGQWLNCAGTTLSTTWSSLWLPALRHGTSNRWLHCWLRCLGASYSFGRVAGSHPC
eukprot:symbB.v1.2.021630.t1/scaffold1854.1/size98632/4